MPPIASRSRRSSYRLPVLISLSLTAALCLGFYVFAQTQPTLSVNSVTVAEGDTGTVDAVFTVTLSAASTQTVTVNYATANNSAVAPSDYTATSGSLIFSPGERTKTVTVTVNGDCLQENNENFFVNLSGATNATISSGSGLGTITSDELPRFFSINSATVAEGDTGTVDAVFTVTLTGQPGGAACPQTATVNYATANNSAVAPGDYTATSGTLTFNPGETSKTVTVTVNADLVTEGTENFFVNLSSATNATISSGTGLCTITPPAAVLVVTNTNDSRAGSLRQAIIDANATSGRQTISFNIAGAGVHTIVPLSALPEFTDPVIVDGTTQPGFSGTPIIEISGAGLSGPVSGIVITAGNSTVRGLVINRFNGGGFANGQIALMTNGGNVIVGNFLGTDLTGSVGQGSTADAGVLIGSSNNTIGGTTAAARNVISGNGFAGIDIRGGNAGSN